MKRIGIRLAALLLAVVLACAFAACSDKKAGGLTEKERERVIELARTFRIFGEYDSEKGFEIRRYEYLVYSLASWSLGESDEVKGYGRISCEDAAALAKAAAVGVAEDSFRTKYKPNEIQVIYAIGDNYFVQLSNDKAYGFEITDVKGIPDENGEDTMVSVTVKVTGGEADFSIAFELVRDTESIFKVKKCEFQSTI